MVASAFAGIVTSESSTTSERMKRIPPSSMNDRSSARKPIETPRTSPSLTACHASSMRDLSAPGSVGSAKVAVNVTPFAVGGSKRREPERLLRADAAR